MINALPCCRLAVMDSLKDLLASKNLDEPSEISSLKAYCQETFGFTPVIKTQPQTVLLLVPNGKLAVEVRGKTLEIIRRCQLTKRLVIRVSFYN